MATPDPTHPRPESPAPRWFQRVLPGLLVGVLAIGLAALVSPGFRDQVALSVSRQQQPYVELYFSRSPSPEASPLCARQHRGALVSFTVASHLDRPGAVAYVVRVSSVGTETRSLRHEGSVATTPDEAAEVTVPFVWARTLPYRVAVTLPGRDQRLVARCAGERP